MKKISISIVAITLIMLAITSCKKPPAVNGGSWTFKSQNYPVTSGIADVTQIPPVSSVYNIATLATISQGSNSYGSIVFTFFSYPTASGTYTITSNQFPDSGSNQIAVNMILAKGASYAQNNYNPSPSSAASVTANVTVGSNGWVTISLPALEMINAADATDSAALTANVKQTAAPE